MFQICRATSIANDGFLALLTQVFLENDLGVPDKPALDRFENIIRQDRVRFLMALEQQRVVGVISVTFSFSTMLLRPYAILGDLYVHPGHRGRGCAAALVAAGMDAAHSEGSSHCVTVSSDGLAGIYQRFGWAPKEEGALIVQLDVDGPPPSLLQTGDFYFD